MSNSKSSSTGISLIGIVFIVFLILKLTGISVVANWSWLWVTCPLWGPLVIGITIGAAWLVLLIIRKVLK